MENFPTFVTVVAALIPDSAGRILLQQCLPHKAHAGLWEFPGGKVESGGTPPRALVREIEEELGIALDLGQLEPIGFAQEEAVADGRPALILLLYNCPRWSGSPEAREGQSWNWFSRAEAAALPLPPMDRALLAHLGAG